MSSVDPISIVTCIYNQEPELFSLCAKSVRQQKGPVEWIVVDDGSTQSGAKVHAQIVAAHAAPNVATRFLTLPTNMGLSKARNLGLQHSSDDWVIILDSDDELAPDLCALLRAVDRNIGLVCFAVEYLKADGLTEVRRVDRWGRLFRRYGGTSRDPFLWFDFYYHGMIARRETFERIGGYNDDLAVGEDQDVLLKAGESLSTDEVQFLDRVGYRYRENPSGVCMRRWEEVELNYSRTMLAAAQRRGAPYSGCRLVGGRKVDGAMVDEYEYLHRESWIRWGDLDE